MLTASFSLFKGLSPSSETALWQRGVFTWKDFRVLADRSPLSPTKRESVLRQIEEAETVLSAGLFDWFLNRLQNADKPRIYPHCRTGIRYIDIETTGYAKSDQITTIAVYDGNTPSAYVKGFNLRHFPEALSGATILVTFNGARFDLPMLRKRFGLDLNLPHIDLLPVTRAYGYTGGLKAIEKKMGIGRGRAKDTDGREAIRLWQRFSDHGDRKALEKLLEYNTLDAVNLEAILVRLYNESMRPWPQHRNLRFPDPPAIPHRLQSLFENLKLDNHTIL